MRRFSRTVLLIVALASAVASAAQTTDPLVGTWKVNVAKSTYDPGPPPQSQIATYEAVDGGHKLITNGVDAKGARTHIEYTAKFDGKAYAVTGNPNADMITMKRVDPRTIEISWMVKGKPTLTSRSVIAPDGKTRTVTQTGTNVQGRKVHNVVVYERQNP